MAGVNGYFQILLGDNVSFVRLYPPVDGGEPIRIDELRDYLTSKGYHVDAVELSKAVSKLGTQPVNFEIAQKRGVPCSESFSIRVTNDKMAAIARFYPFSTAGAALTREEIISDLNFKGIKMGIDENVISEFLSDKKYCTDYVIANGLEPTLGSDAKIEYFFNTNPNTKPKQNEDGSVDFFDLNTISKCTKNQVLAELKKEVKGERGYNVCGEVLLPRDVKKLVLKYNRNVALSDDGCKITALCDGHVSLVDDKVFVSDTYEVVDVDTSTGNIDYKGNILITGNVKAGFIVKAEGDVEVRGVVEGAIIEATGNVIIARGMNGMGRGVLTAGGNVVAKFFENTTVTAGGYVRAEAILHSKISAKGEINVDGRKGFIIGGVIRSMETVSAKTIGTEMGVDTEIEVGIDPGLKNKSIALEQAINSNRKKLSMIEPVILTLTKKLKSGEKLTIDQTNYFKQLSQQYKALNAQIVNDTEEYNQILESMENNKVESIIRVSGITYAGTRLTIGDVSTTLSSSVSHSRFVKDGADIRVRAL